MDRTPSPAPSAEAATELLGWEQVAQAIGVSRHTISGWIAHGDLPMVRIGRWRRIAPAELAAAHTRLHLKRRVTGPQGLGAVAGARGGGA